MTFIKQIIVEFKTIMAVFIQSPAGIISTMTKLFLVLLGEPQESLSRPCGGPRTPCWEPLTAHLIRVFILVVFYLLSSSLIFTNAGRSASALQVSWRRSACATARLVTEKGLPLSQCSITPKPHCRTCSFVISRFLFLPPPPPDERQEWASFSDHYSSKKFKRGMPFNFFPSPNAVRH